MTEEEIRAAFPPGIVRFPWLSEGLFLVYTDTRNAAVRLRSLANQWVGWHYWTGTAYTPERLYRIESLEWRASEAEYDREYLSRFGAG